MNSIAIKKQKIRLPMFFMSLYFLATPLSIIPMPGDISLLKLVTIIVVIFMVPLLFVGENEIKPNSVHLAWIAYLIYSFSSLFHLREEISIDTLRGIVETTALAFLISLRVYNSREKRYIYNIWLLTGAIMVFLMVFASNVLVNSDNRETIYIFGYSEDPNQVCGYFILPLVICMERMLHKEDKRFRIIYILFLIAMIYCVFKTGSRGGLVAIMTTVFLYTIISIKGMKNRIITAIVILAVLFIIIYFIIPILPETIMNRFNIERILEDRASNRFNIWLVLLTDMKTNIENFVFGKGFYATAEALSGAGISNTVAHNHIIQVLYDQGLIGCMLFIIMLATSAVRTFKRNRILTVALFGMMVLSMSITVYPYYKPFWNVLIMGALNFVEEEEKNA